MTQPAKLFLLDADFRRRAAMSHLLATTGIHAEPFEDLAELSQRWPRDSVVFVHDEAGMVPAAIAQMSERGQWLPLIAYAENPDPDRVVQAVLNGAIDYLDWPLDAAKMQGALLVAEPSRTTLGSGILREAMARSRVQKLTRREREVLVGVPMVCPIAGSVNGLRSAPALSKSTAPSCSTKWAPIIRPKRSGSQSRRRCSGDRTYVRTKTHYRRGSSAAIS